MPKMRGRATIKALPAFLKKMFEEEVYRVYTTDALRVMCENTAKMVAGKYIENRYLDIVTPKKEDTRTEQEIIDHVLSRGWGVKRNECI